MARGFGEAPQQGYVAKAPVPPGEIDPDLARALGIDDPDDDAKVDARNVITPDMGPAHLRLARPAFGGVDSVAGLASQQSLDRLLREGRAEFRDSVGDKVWTRTGRRARKSPKAAARWSSSRTSSRKATSRRRSPTWSKAPAVTTAPRFCWASPAQARPSPWRR